MGRRIQKPFFYFEELKDFDKVAIGAYGIFTVVLIFVFFFADDKTKQFVLIMYCILPQLFIYFFLYVSLRNFTAYLIWFAFGLLNLILFFFFKSNERLNMVRGNPAWELLNTIILLWLFQVLRFLSLKVQKREFRTVSRNGKDLFENKDISGTDYLIFIIYFVSWFGLTMLSII
jgi:hypothetical protein